MLTSFTGIALAAAKEIKALINASVERAESGTVLGRDPIHQSTCTGKRWV